MEVCAVLVMCHHGEPMLMAPVGFRGVPVELAASLFPASAAFGCVASLVVKSADFLERTPRPTHP